IDRRAEVSGRGAALRERGAGLAAEPSGAGGGKIGEASSVLLARGPGADEVFLVRRGEVLRFFGGFWAFPGGKVDSRDAAVPVQPGGSDDGFALRRATAARELFEETGVLLARAADGSLPAALPEADRWRHELLADRLSFAELLLRLGLTLH